MSTTWSMPMNQPVFVWQHLDMNGRVIGNIRRYVDHDGSKSDIPYYHFENDTFKAGIPEQIKHKGYPLFGLETFCDPSKPLIICEGQKSQAAFAGLGFQCVTSILGANNAHCSNWDTIKNASMIYLIPDNDESGEKYIQDVHQMLSTFPVKIIRLPDLCNKGDICDWIKQQPEIGYWNELTSLKDNPSRDILHERLQQIMNDNLHDVPPEWTLADWAEPEVIQHVLLPVEPLQDCLIPEPFREWITDVAERMQCPKDFIAVAAIAITASIIGAGCGIKPKQQDDWLVIPNLWGGIIGRPGMLKTPAVSEVMQLLSQLEREAKKIFDARLAEHQADLEFYKAEKEALKSAMLNSKKLSLKNKSENESYDALSLKDKFSHLSEPEKPIWKRFKTNDATIEKLSELLVDNPRGLLLYRDELMGLLSSWDQEGRESDRAFFLEAWNGYGSLTTDRIGRGTVHTENLCVSIYGNTQPAKLTRYLYQAMRGMDNDGLLQRFQLLIYPDEPTDWQLIDRKPNYQAKERASGIIKNLVEMDFVQVGAVKDPHDRFPSFHFDDEAQKYFYIWLTELETEKLHKEDQPILMEHLAKYRSLMPSLALLFHLIDVADGKGGDKVSFNATALAIGWCNYMESHARRIYGMASQGARQSTINLCKKIQAGELTSPFSLRDVYKKEWALLDEKEVVQKACEELIESGWLKREIPLHEMGRPKMPMYAINPKVKIKS
jgi:hypothetical protein